MIRALPLLVLMGCAPDPGRIQALPVVGSPAAPTVAFAVVGPTAGGEGAQALVADVAAAATRDEITFVVLLGDQVERSRAKQWEALADRWEPVVAAGARLWGLVGGGETRGDRDLVGFSAAFPHAGPDPRDAPAGWDRRTVLAAGQAWHLVALETDQRAMGTRWAEERFWLPRAVGGDEPLLVFIPDGPDADGVLAAALDQAPPHAPVAIWRVGPANAVELPGGSWGEARISVASTAISAPGWFLVRLHGTEMDLTLRPLVPEVSPAPNPWRYRPDSGWERPDSQP